MDEMKTIYAILWNFFFRISYAVGIHLLFQFSVFFFVALRLGEPRSTHFDLSNDRWVLFCCVVFFLSLLFLLVKVQQMKRHTYNRHTYTYYNIIPWNWIQTHHLICPLRRASIESQRKRHTQRKRKKYVWHIKINGSLAVTRSTQYWILMNWWWKKRHFITGMDERRKNTQNKQINIAAKHIYYCSCSYAFNKSALCTVGQLCGWNQ